MSGWRDISLGWTLSIALHVALLFGAALIVLEQFLEADSDLDIGFNCGIRHHGVLLDSLEAPQDVLDRRGTFDESDSGSDIRKELVDLQSAIPDRPREPAEMESGVPKGFCSQGSLYVLGFGDASLSSRTNGHCKEQSGWITGSVLHYETRRGTSNLVERGATLRIANCGGRSLCRLHSACPASLRWLARHQSPDGSWSANGFGRCCKRARCSGAGLPEFDEGVTALALLAFLGAGFSPCSKDVWTDPAVPEQQLHFGESVKWGLQWLLGRQDAEGAIGRRGSKFIYNHAIATLALTEAYGVTGIETLREPAQKAIDFLVAAQNPGSGWRYGARDGESDTSVTGWAVLAVESARLSQLQVPASAPAGALAWIDRATEHGPIPRVGYNEAGSGKVFIPGRNESFADHPTMSAVGVLSRLFLTAKRNDPTLAAGFLLMADLPSSERNKVDACYWYFGSLALYQLEGPVGARWKKWNEPLKTAIVPKCKTERDGCENGSWDPADDRWGTEGGRVYSTAMNSLTLEIYYRYEVAFGVNNANR